MAHHDFPRLSASPLGNVGPSGAGGLELLPALHLEGGEAAYLAVSGGPTSTWSESGLGAWRTSPLSVNFTSSWQPWALDRDRFCLPETENVYSLPTWNTQAISLRTPDFLLVLKREGMWPPRTSLPAWPHGLV